MAFITVVRKLAPGVVCNFVERRSGKVVASGTAPADGSPFTIAVPVGSWHEQHVRTLTESGGPSRTFTDTSPQPVDLETGNGTSQLGPTVTASDGSLWQIGVVPVADPNAAPSMASSGAGGAIAAGTYQFAFTWVTPTGESKASPNSTNVVLAGATSQVTPTVPALPAGVIGWNFYATATGQVSPLTKQNATPLTGTSQAFTAALTTNGANPPSASSAGLIGATKLA